jgi:hypothetical protein
MKRFLIISGMVFLLMGMCMPAPAAAYYESNTKTIDEGYYLYFTLTWSQTGTLSYTASASSGDPNFDIFFIDSSEYSKYQSGDTFEYYSACSHRDTRYSSKSCTVYSGSYYLIFDNTEVGPAEPYYGETVTITYTVETSEGSNGNGGDDDSFLYMMICGFIGFFILIVIIAVVVTRMRKKKSVAYKVPSTPAPSYQSSYSSSQPPQDFYAQPQHTHSHAPPPQTPAGYKTTPREEPRPAYSPPPQPTGLPEAKQPEEPPKLVLPGMIGGTEDTLEDAYSGPPKPKQPPKF